MVNATPYTIELWMHLGGFHGLMRSMAQRGQMMMMMMGDCYGTKEASESPEAIHQPKKEERASKLNFSLP